MSEEEKQISIRNNFANNDQSLFARAGFFDIINLSKNFHFSDFHFHPIKLNPKAESSIKLPYLDPANKNEQAETRISITTQFIEVFFALWIALNTKNRKPAITAVSRFL